MLKMNPNTLKVSIQKGLIVLIPQIIAFYSFVSNSWAVDLPIKDFEIPAVIDRPWEIDEGPRFIVKAVRLEGVRERPSLDIKVKDDPITQVIEAIFQSGQFLINHVHGLRS